MQVLISVIICTHNPRPNYLGKVLAALQSQTLPLEEWELLLIDNASDHPLSSKINLSWHPNARHIREDNLGLTPARLRGIKEAAANILVFVDDDNVLDGDFLQITLEISKDYPLVGAWGGQIVPEFEETPPEWTKPYWGMLAIREFDRDQWSNLLHQEETTPCGAGLCVRKKVAETYAQVLQTDPRRQRLDRKGQMLSSCGDTDLAYTACDIGLGTGQFTALKLTHLIPASRLREEYLLRLIQGLYYSGTLLGAYRGKLPTEPCLSQKILQWYSRWRMDARRRRFLDASEAGRVKAMQEISTW
jgi:hypothetical protein